MLNHLQRLPLGLFLTASVLLQAACITLPEMKNRWSFECPDGYAFVANYSRNMQSVRLVAADFSEKLPLRESDEATAQARYANNAAEFLPRGVMADLYIGPDTQSGYAGDSGTVAAHLQCQGNAY